MPMPFRMSKVSSRVFVFPLSAISVRGEGVGGSGDSETTCEMTRIYTGRSGGLECGSVGALKLGSPAPPLREGGLSDHSRFALNRAPRGMNDA